MLTIGELIEKKRQEKDQKRATDRAIEKIQGYILQNDFDIFVTFTYDPRRLHDYTRAGATSQLRKWLMRQHVASRDARKDFKFLMVPDSYGDERVLRFHAIISGHSFPLKATRIVLGDAVARTIPGFRFGFTTVVDISAASKEQLVDRMMTHITSAPPSLPYAHRYFASRNLELDHHAVAREQAGLAERTLYRSLTDNIPSARPTLPG